MKNKMVFGVGEENRYPPNIMNEKGQSIIEFIDWLIECAKSGATHISFDAMASSDYEGGLEIDEVSIQPFFIREETDDEYNARIKQEEDKVRFWKEKIRVKEFKTFQELKNKFESE